MNREPEQCPVCDTPSSAWLDGNCPFCLMGLASIAPTDEGQPQPTDGIHAGHSLADTNLEVLREVGDYELLGEIARGGMGVVYRARQKSLNRFVAVKVLLGGRFTNETFAKRFQLEAESAAILNHPNIVSIYEVGAEQGQPYFSMELIEGQNLAEMTRDKPLPSREAVRLVKIIAEAVQFAHEHGVLHRDLKPSNVLVDIQGAPHVTDFGLAKRVAGNDDLTLTGQVLGTPNYMPPEQADPKRGPITAASDVYSLGAMLYHLLTGRALFLSETVHGTLRQVLEQEPVSPRLLNGTVPRDIETICLKCLNKEPERRFETARELAEELGRWLSGVPILSRPSSPVEKAWRWCRRNPAVAIAGSVALTLLLVIAIGSPIATIRINRARLAAEANQRRAEDESAKARRAEKIAKERGEETRRNLYAAEMNMANQVLDLMNGILRISGVVSKWEYQRPDLRGWEWYYLNSLCHRESANLRGHTDQVSALSASSDGLRLASGSHDGTARIWDVLTGKELAAFRPSTNPVTAVSLSADGTRLAVAEWGWLGILDALSGKELLRFPVRPNGLGTIWSMDWTKDSRRLAVGGESNILQVYDVEGGRLLSELKGHQKEVRSVAWSSDNTRLASASQDNTVRIWDPVTGKEVLGPLQHHDWALGVSWSSDDGALATACLDSFVRIWDTKSGATLANYRPHSFVVDAVAWRPGTKQIASTSSLDNYVHLWGWGTNRTLTMFRGHTQPLKALTWSPNGAWLATGGAEGVIKVWSPEANDAQTLNDSIQGAAGGLAWSPDGTRLAIGLANGFVSIFDATSQKVVHTFPTMPFAVHWVAWSPDGTRLAAAITGEASALVSNVPLSEVRATSIPGACIAIWDARSGEQLQVLPGHSSFVRKCAWSPDSKRVISAEKDGVARIYDAQTGRELLALRGTEGAIYAVDWSPDGKRVATGTRNKLGIQIWNAETGEQVLKLPRTQLWDIAWSPDGTRAASAHEDGTVVIWDGVTWKEKFVFRGHTAYTWCGGIRMGGGCFPWIGSTR